MLYSLDSLHASVSSGTLHPEWASGQGRVSSVRSSVEEFLRTGGTAYGFSTFLGHLDDRRLEPSDSAAVLEAHLVGVPVVQSREVSQYVTAVKLSQLSHGASGISVELYGKVLDAFERQSRIAVDLEASYGSGDVVPGAWWLNSVAGPGYVWRAGDVIAGINGSFVPAGVLLSLHTKLRDLLLGSVSDVKAVSEALQVGHLVADGEDVQLPVSLRACDPLEAFVDTALGAVDSALLASVNGSSGNPLWQPAGEGVVPWSNSSFLDFRLSSAVLQVFEALRVVAAYEVRTLNALSAILEAQEGAVLHGVEHVQPPKVAKAYLDRIDALNLSGGPVIQAESLGVEDISDSCLSRVLQLEQGMGLLAKIRCLTESAMQSAEVAAG